jgi:hypothetical protein
LLRNTACPSSTKITIRQHHDLETNNTIVTPIPLVIQSQVLPIRIARPVFAVYVALGTNAHGVKAKQKRRDSTTKLDSTHRAAPELLTAQITIDDHLIDEISIPTA